MKARPIPPFVPEEHIEIGNRMRDMRASLMLVVRRMLLGSPIHDDALAAIMALDRVRTHLDCDLHMLVRASRDPRQMVSKVYSGTDNLVWRDYSMEEIVTDDFAVWGLAR
ncbi:hypothetical protein [Magnetospirillum sp. SS-4]|uniref:hypothetical protein n=1 Tax=Magnetospirillum sp. SS-4 TaxID=2681465 RepID=UPI00137C4309|nr:hypothetical protein [Magnetospirillum sp. SS-4]CAA7619062.1 conserved hypothetical protein [Magnetospirillum sp. SS-4]